MFNFCRLHVSNPKDHLQEYGYIYRYGIIRYTCISISRLVGRKMCSTYKTAYTDAYIALYLFAVYTVVFLMMNPRVQNT